MLFNPTKKEIRTTITVSLYYTGLTKESGISKEEGEMKVYQLSRNYEVQLPVILKPESYYWWVIE